MGMWGQLYVEDRFMWGQLPSAFRPAKPGKVLFDQPKPAIA